MLLTFLLPIKGSLEVIPALTYYMGVVKKDLIQHYWSIDATLSTPFPRTVMSRNEFENIFSFLHCCNNQDYATKGTPGYDPKKKLGITYEKLLENIYIYIKVSSYYIIILHEYFLMIKDC